MVAGRDMGLVSLGWWELVWSPWLQADLLTPCVLLAPKMLGLRDKPGKQEGWSGFSRWVRGPDWYTKSHRSFGLTFLACWLYYIWCNAVEKGTFYIKINTNLLWSRMQTLHEFSRQATGLKAP